MEPTTPRLGDRAFCFLCGRKIEYLGPCWRHLDWRPRHVARPDPDAPYERATVTRETALAASLPVDYQI